SVVVRLEAINALGKHLPRKVLKALLRDENISIRKKAIYLLKDLNVRIPREELVAILQDDSKFARELLKGRQGRRVPPDALLAALVGSDETMREAAVRQLRRLRIFRRPYTQAVQEVTREAQALLLDHSPGPLLNPIGQAFIADVIGQLESPSPALL